MEEAKEMVLARLHLRAILPLLEDIAEYDPQVQELTKGWNAVIQFQLPGGDPAAALIFKQGRLEAVTEDCPGPKVTLTFNNPWELNDVFQGKSDKNPRPNLMALLHMAKLTKIDQVLGRLEHYLKPQDDLLNDRDAFAFCVKLSIYALTYGIREVGEYDPELNVISPGLPEGTLAINVIDGPSSSVTVKNGKFFPAKGPAQKPNAILEICDLETAWAMIQGRLDIFAAVGGSKIKIRGFVPLLDGINPLMDRLSQYLA